MYVCKYTCVYFQNCIHVLYYLLSTTTLKTHYLLFVFSDCHMCHIILRKSVNKFIFNSYTF